VAPETIELTIRSPRPSFDPPERLPVVPPPAPPPVDRPTILDAAVPRPSAPPLAPPPIDRPTILDAPVPRPSPPPPEDRSAATQLITPLPAAIPTPAPAPPVARPPATKAPAGPARGGPNVPASVTRTGSNPLPLLGGIAAILILMVIAFLFMQSQKQDPGPVAAVTTTVVPPVEPPAVVPPPGTDTTPVTTIPADALTTAEPPPPASMTSVVIDIRPWARVRITVAPPAEGQTATPPAVQLPVEARFAPFTIDLPAGDYLLECENGGLNRAATIPLKVAEPQGRPQFFTRTMPGFNSTKIVDSLLPRD
jgi:hypothetical protein